MKKIVIVIRHELSVTFKRPSFVFFAFLVPCLAFILVNGVRIIQERSGKNPPLASDIPNENSLKVEGYVDFSCIVKVIPDNLPSDCLVAYETELDARKALQEGEITAFYVIPKDYLAAGEIFYVYPEAKSLVSDGQEWIMRWTLMINLLGGDVAVADMAWNPVKNLEVVDIATQSGENLNEDCSRPGFACKSNSLIRYLPFIMIALFYISFMSISGMLFNSIGKEKENRTLEVLLLSITPLQIFTGKIIAYAIAGLVQTAAWVGSIAATLNTGGYAIHLPANFVFPTPILIWSLVYYLGGFAVYASLMAGAGALVPKMKEAGAANFIILVPLLAAYIVGFPAILAEQSQAVLPVALSIFPLTAPILMVMRLTDGAVPLWQLLLSNGLIFATAYWILRAVTSMFHAQNLLSGQPFSIRRYARALFRTN